MRWALGISILALIGSAAWSEPNTVRQIKVGTTVTFTEGLQIPANMWGAKYKHCRLRLSSQQSYDRVISPGEVFTVVKAYRMDYLPGDAEEGVLLTHGSGVEIDISCLRNPVFGVPYFEFKELIWDWLRARI